MASSAHASKPAKPSSSALQDILSGTMGGIAQVVVGHPLDTVKVRMQAAGNQGTLASVFLEGVKARSLYAGATSPLAGAMVHNAALFFTIGQTKVLMRRLYPEEVRPVRDAFVGGAVVGVVATVVETPVDLLKCKAQSAPELGVFRLGKTIYSGYGLAGLWQGAGATGLRNIPCFSMYFGFNVASKEHFKRPDGSVALFHQFVSGAAAGFGFWGLLYPLDIVKSRMQIQPTDKSKRLYTGIVHCAREILREGGIKAMYRGYAPALIRALLVNGSVFLTFEIAKAQLAKRSQ